MLTMFATTSRMVGFQLRKPVSIYKGISRLTFFMGTLIRSSQKQHNIVFFSTAHIDSQERPKLKSSGISHDAFLELSKTKVMNQQLSDRNGLPLLVTISEEAAKHLRKVTATDNKPNTALRISVESGGCHGFEYVFKLTDTSEYHPDKEDSLFVRDGAKVIMDKTSLEILRNSKIDYVHELIGSQFKVVDSPFLKSSCGCGSSFEIDYSKLDEEAK